MEGSLPAPATVVRFCDDSRMVVYRLVGRDVRAAGGVSIIDTIQPVGGVTLRLIS